MALQVNAKAWDDFVAWCQRRRLCAIPANPWTIAAYARWCEPIKTPRAIAKAVKEISTVYESKTRKRIDRDPLVQRTLEMIENRRAKAKEKPKLDLFEEAPSQGRPRRTAKKLMVKKNSKKGSVAKNSQSRIKRGLSASPRLVSKRCLLR